MEGYSISLFHQLSQGEQVGGDVFFFDALAARIAATRAARLTAAGQLPAVRLTASDDGFFRQR
jgi:hypothetical protein